MSYSYTGAAGGTYAGALVDEVQLPEGKTMDGWRVVQERAGTLPQMAYTRGLDLSRSPGGAGAADQFPPFSLATAG